MIEIIRGTTPTIEMTVKSDIDLSMVAQIWAYISQRDKVKIDKSLSDATIDVEHKIITIRLSQEDTLALEAERETTFQIRLLLSDSTALGIIEVPVQVYPVRKDGVITPEV